MLFLGAASRFSKRERRKHTFAIGLPSDSKKLCRVLSDHYGTTFNRVALTNSGRSALAIALKTTIPRNSKVIISGFTCYAVVEAVKAANCIPIFADIEPTDLNYSPSTLRKLIIKHPDIKAFILQNTLGNTVDVTVFERLAKQHNLVIIEDLAHCAGSLYPDGRECGTVGDAAALTFGKGKTIDTTTGGAVILRNQSSDLKLTPSHHPRLADSFRARFYPFFGMLIRASYRLHLEKIITGGFLACHLIERSADTKLDLETRPAHWQAKLALAQIEAFPKKGRTPIRNFALVENRDEVLEKLKKNGYNFDETWYEVPVAPTRYYKKVHFPESECKNSVKIAKTIINIPTWYNKSKLNLAYKIIKEAKNE